MSTRFWNVPWRRLLPDSAFWRLVLATAVLGVFTAVGAMVVSNIIGKNLVHSINEESAYTVLRNTVDMIGRTSIQIEESRSLALEAKKQSLLESMEFIDGFLLSHAAAGELEPAARQESLARLQTLAAGSADPSFGILDAQGRLLVHDPDGIDLRSRQTVLRELQAAAMAQAGRDVFTLEGLQQGQDALLAVARHNARWNLTYFALAAFHETPPALVERRRLTLNEMRARINEIVVAESGYLYVFNQQCEMIVHPTLVGENFASLLLPGTDKTMCETLRRTAEKAWGENRLTYNWDRPEDNGNYRYQKVSWCTVEPTTGWVVGASAYVTDLQGPLPAFVARIFLPALGSILLLGLALALILRSQLRPVNILSGVCQRVSHGDLDASAPQDVSGEIGKLCWHFNAMIKRLRGLRQRDERRRKELENLNASLEKKVRLRTRALERKAHKLEEANSRLKELDALKTGFVSSVSHELRTPLTSILGFAKMINRDFSKLLGGEEYKGLDHRKPAKRITGNLNIIVQEGERLSRLINDLLDLARIEAGRLEWHDGLLDFQELAMDCLDSMGAQFRSKPDVCLRHDIAPNLPPLYGDRDRLTQVLLNLMNNALKFTQQGEIRLAACVRDGVLQCRVQDSGTGIKREELLHVFDKFHQISSQDTRAEKPAGTGLGLAICHNILEHYNGLIWCESLPGEGACFVFEMPLRADLEAMEGVCDEQAQRRVVREKDPADAEPPLVLVVDDDQHVQLLLLHLFEDAGYRVTTASDGATALKRVRATHPDLITMDLLMPGMLGSEAIERLRSDPQFADTPVILVSALADAEADDHTHSDAVLSKPIDEELLLATAQALLLQENAPAPRLKQLLTSEAQWRQGTPYLCDEQGNCCFCPLSELEERVAAGFTGTIYVPHQHDGVAELRRVVSAAGVQVVML